MIDMGYTNYNRIRIRPKNDKRKNPLATITIPYSIVKSLGWKDKDLIIFEKYSSKNSQDITMTNLNRCPKNQQGGKFVKLIGENYQKRINFEKMLRGFPKKTQKELKKFFTKPRKKSSS